MFGHSMSIIKGSPQRGQKNHLDLVLSANWKRVTIGLQVTSSYSFGEGAGTAIGHLQTWEGFSCPVFLENITRSKIARR